MRSVPSYHHYQPAKNVLKYPPLVALDHFVYSWWVFFFSKPDLAAIDIRTRNREMGLLM